MRYRRDTEGSSLVALLNLVVVIVGIFFLFFAGLFVDEAIAVRAPETFGFTRVEVVESHRFFAGLRGCGYLDSTQFEVRAINPAEQQVTVYVCAGWPFKSATIRVK